MTKHTKHQLPAGWSIESLSQLGLWRGGGTPSKAETSFWKNGTIPWVSPKDMKVQRIFSAEDKITESALKSSATNLIESGSVLIVTRSGILRHSLPVAVTEVNTALNQDLKSLTPHQGVDPYYLLYAFECFEQDILHICCKGGTTVQSIEFPRLLQYTFPISPLGEQRRIVAKIEELFTKLDAGVASLKAAKAQLKRYRQAVLKAAVEGELTREWREQHKNELEPASELLARILRERRAKWEADQLAKMQAQGKTPKDDGWMEEYQEPVATDSNYLPEFPDEWQCATIEQMSKFVQYGSSSKTTDDEGGIPVLRMGNIVDGRLNFNSLKYLPLNHEEFPTLLLSKGDVVFNRTNSAELVGKTAVYNGSPAPCSFASYLIRVRLSESYEANLLAYFINSNFGRRWIASVVSQQVGQANVNGTKLQALSVPLPPLDEQRQIIAEVERRLSIADEIEATLDAELKRAEHLRQSILKRAFEGKLVPQDPNDEPAAVLLERIKAERAQKESQASNGKRTTRKRKSSTEAMDEPTLPLE